MDKSFIKTAEVQALFDKAAAYENTKLVRWPNTKIANAGRGFQAVTFRLAVG